MNMETTIHLGLLMWFASLVVNIYMIVGIRILEAHKLTVISQSESKSIHRRNIFILLDCGQCSGKCMFRARQ